MSKKQINLFVGSIGFYRVFVFIAYIPQIIANLQGVKAQPFQPLFAAVSFSFGSFYGWTKEPKRTDSHYSKYCWCNFRRINIPHRFIVITAINLEIRPNGVVGF